MKGQIEVEHNKPNIKNKTLYLCDRKKCSNCSDMCKHTTDVSHALNFIKDEKSGLYLEFERD